MVRGSRSEAASGGLVIVCRCVTAPVRPRCGAVRTGRWPDRRAPMTRIGHSRVRSARVTVRDVPRFFPSRSARQSGSPIGAALLGTGLVAAGLGLAFLIVETPLASRLVSGGWTGSGQLPFAAVLLPLGLIAGAGLLVGGTDRLAITLAALRTPAWNRSPLARALNALPGDVSVVRGVVPYDGRPVPTLVVGRFGVAVVDEIGPADRLRRVDGSWEARHDNGWAPTEHPVDRVARDAERVRHWLTHGELDFVVRVYAAVVTRDATIRRSPLCAVVTIEQIPSWIEGLPRQRSLNDGRRHVLLARVREAIATKSGSRAH